MAVKKSGLGKGLDALIPSAAAQPKTKEKKEKETSQMYPQLTRPFLPTRFT